MNAPGYLNARAGWAIIKSRWLSWLQQRGFFFVLAFGWMVPPLIYLFVWSTAAGEGQLSGMGRGEFVAYYLVLIMVNQFTYSQTNWTVGDEIREGLLTPWLLRPVPVIYHVLAYEVSGRVVFMAFVIPVSALLAVVLKPTLDATLAEGLLFIPALALAWTLRFLWGYWLALLAFWATRADALLALQNSLTFLLAGMVAPVTLLPPALQAAARVLPFRYMIGFPVEVLTGHLSAAELAAGFGIQGVWTLAALALTLVTWRSGVRRYTAIGG